MKKILAMLAFTLLACNVWSTVPFYGAGVDFVGGWKFTPFKPGENGEVGMFHTDFGAFKNLPEGAAYWYLAPDFQIRQRFGRKLKLVSGADEEGLYLRIPHIVNLRVSWEDLGYQYYDGLGIYLGYKQAPDWLENLQIDPYLGYYSWDFNDDGKADLEVEFSKDPSEPLPYQLDALLYSMFALPSPHPFGPFLGFAEMFPCLPQEVIDCLEELTIGCPIPLPNISWCGEFEGSILLQAIPEPTSIALLLSGLAGLALFYRKK